LKIIADDQHFRFLVTNKLGTRQNASSYVLFLQGGPSRRVEEVSVSSEIFRKLFSKLVIYPQEESITSGGGRYCSSESYGDTEDNQYGDKPLPIIS
jgi:hypothetical protein